MDANPDANPHAVGDGPDDDVFGPVDDGEEIFEWIDDEPEPAAGPAAAGLPAPSLRERLTALRAAVLALRGSRRRIGAVAVSLLLATAVGAACTAWFDGVAGAADRAAVVAMTVNSVVDGDPSVTSYDAAHTSATAEYVVELANNSPTTVTLSSVGFDAGTLMSSTGWKPAAGTPRIPAGATAKVALTVRLFCPMMLLGAQTGAFGVSGRGGEGPSSMPFPELEVKVLDGNGDQRDLTLATHVPVDSLLRNQTGELTFLGSGTEPTPQIVTADARACQPWEAQRERQLADRDDSGVAHIDPERHSAGLTFAYDKVLSQDRNAFTLAIDVRNTTGNKLTLATRNDAGFQQDPAVRTTWLPTRVDVDPGQTQQVRLTVSIHNCDLVLSARGALSELPAMAESQLEVDDPDTGLALPSSPDQLMTGSLRLASDTARQVKAVCP